MDSSRSRADSFIERKVHHMLHLKRMGKSVLSLSSVMRILMNLTLYFIFLGFLSVSQGIEDPIYILLTNVFDRAPTNIGIVIFHP